MRRINHWQSDRQPESVDMTEGSDPFVFPLLPVDIFIYQSQKRLESQNLTTSSLTTFLALAFHMFIFIFYWHGVWIVYWFPSQLTPKLILPHSYTDFERSAELIICHFVAPFILRHLLSTDPFLDNEMRCNCTATFRVRTNDRRKGPMWESYLSYCQSWRIICSMWRTTTLSLRQLP
jgi:hypothetical protein